MHYRELVLAKEGQAKDYPDGIPECGTDALRFALMAYTSQGRDINLVRDRRFLAECIELLLNFQDVLRVQGYRHFCNKIWQACRFTLMQLGKDYKPEPQFKLTGVESALDKWILSRLAYAVEQVDTNIAEYKFQNATTAIYNFCLYDFCDFYIEATKPVFYGSDAQAITAARHVLYLCIDTALRLLSPFMPFITEELWQRLPKRASEKAISIHVSEFPEVSEFSFRDEKLEGPINFAIEVVKKVRSKRSDLKLLPKTKTDSKLFSGVL